MSYRMQFPEEDRTVFSAKLYNVRNIYSILKTVHFKETCLISASVHGIKVTVETSKCMQANAFIQADLFEDFRLMEDSVTIKVNLNVLLDCLNIFGSSTSSSNITNLVLTYDGHGSPLRLLLEDNGIITDCSLKTMEPENIMEFEFGPANLKNKVIMQAECLKEAFNELDQTSDVLEIVISPDKPYLQLATFGESGRSFIDFPKTSETIESFECTQTQSCRYKMALIKQVSKALAIAQKTSIRTDNNGFLCLQFMIQTQDEHTCFVEYYCSPDVTSENDYGSD